MSGAFTNSFSEETWFQKYKLENDTTVEDTWMRVATDLASVEKTYKKKWAKKFYSVLEGFKFVPGGRITSNAGSGLKGTTYINCFVDGFTGSDQDSIEGIYRAITRQAQILKSEGGYGFCADVMRPRGAHIGGIGNQSPGAVKFLELWDKSSEIITAGSGNKSRADEKNFIRKGAQMVTMSCWHPDIVEFINAKKTPGVLSKFNMSVLCTDEFMRAVIDDTSWDLVFPDIENHPKNYRSSWNGSLDEWMSTIGRTDLTYGLRSYYTFDSARDLWDLIMSSTYGRNEPGVLFVDTINTLNNLYYEEHISATNPCGEQVLPIGGVCLLGSLNLVHFIDPETQEWKYEELKRTIPIAIRLMDNVNDKTSVPLKMQKDQLQSKRRIGLGIMGYASALMMAKVKYGSKQALQMTERLMEFVTNQSYQASALLAKDKGAFPLYNAPLYNKSEFTRRLSKETKSLMSLHGMRNSHVTSIQPTGNGSVFANLVSGGLEPLFMHGYIRTSVQQHCPDSITVPSSVDWDKGNYKYENKDDATDWKWIKEGDENLLAIEIDGKVWKMDRARGLLKEEWVEDYGVSFLKKTGAWKENASWNACAMNLDVQSHIDTMSIFAHWVDSAISKTINLPNDYPYEDFKSVYMKAWERGIKGFTTYRTGTTTSVLSESSSLSGDSSSKIVKTEAPERPRELPCNVHHITVKGEPYFVLVGMHEGDPYEIFAGKNGFIGKSIKSGILIKFMRPKGVYKAILEDGLEISPVNSTCSEEEDALTRMTSTALRHGACIQYVVQQLEKVKGDMTSFAKCMARALKKYIPDGSEEKGECPECGKDALIRQEGCIACTQCGYSKCH
jgi:ribonucleoside-diphosphate reductase alpha chain